MATATATTTRTSPDTPPNELLQCRELAVHQLLLVTQSRHQLVPRGALLLEQRSLVLVQVDVLADCVGFALELVHEVLQATVLALQLRVLLCRGSQLLAHLAIQFLQ